MTNVKARDLGDALCEALICGANENAELRKQNTELAARLERMQKALKTLNSRWGVRSGECYTCDLRHGKHSSDCPIPEIESLLAEALEEKP